jgi:hypothetical protein
MFVFYVLIVRYFASFFSHFMGKNVYSISGINELNYAHLGYSIKKKYHDKPAKSVLIFFSL